MGKRVQHVGRRTSQLAGLLALAVVAACLGASPFGVTVVAAATWIHPLVSRVSRSSTVVVLVIAWITTTFLAAVCARATHSGVAATVFATHAVLGVLGIVMGWRERTSRVTAHTDSAPLRVFVAASVGSVLWVITWALTRLGVGTGLSWSIYGDSTRDVWFIRQNLLAGGVPFGGQKSPWPVEHALTTAQLSIHEVFGSSSEQVEAQLDAHAFGWTVVISTACLLAGILAGTMTWRLTRMQGLALSSAAIGSLLVLWMPITGFALRAGQLNLHLVIVLALASYLTQVDNELPSWVGASVQGTIACLLLLVWAPFAVLPLVFCAWQLRHARSVGSLNKPIPVMVLGLTAISSTLLIGVFVVPALMPVAETATSTSDGALAIESAAPNPASFWVSGAVLFIALACIGLLWSRDKRVVATVIVLVASATASVAGFALIRGGLRIESEYYAAKLLSMMTIVVGLCLVGAVVALVWASRRAAVPLVFLCASGLVAGVPEARGDAEPWKFAPQVVLAGDSFGLETQTFDRIVAFSRDDALVLAWRLEVPYDFAVNFMQSVVDRSRTDVWSTPLRAEMRNNRLDLSTARLCSIAQVAGMPVEVHTSDPELARELADECPGLTIGVTVASDPDVSP